MTDQRMLSPAEVAVETGVPIHAIRRLIRADKVTYYRIGRRTYLYLNEFIDEIKVRREDDETESA
jgi:hypothetical protein